MGYDWDEMDERRWTPIVALFAANFISVTGEALASVAILWFVLSTTGSAAQTGVTGFVLVTPVILATFFGGAFVDRVGYKRVSILADLASGVTVALIPLLYVTVGLPFWQLLILVFLTNLLDAPGTTARSALIPELAAQAGMSLERASALQDSVSRATRMIGAPVGGLLTAAIGPINVLWLDAASFAVSAVLVAFFVSQTGDSPVRRQPTRYLDEVQEGLNFFRKDRLIMTVVTALMLANFLDAGFVLVFAPVFSERVYGAETGSIQLGLMQGVFGAGALVGSILMGTVGRRLSRRWLLSGGLAIIALRWFCWRSRRRSGC